MCTLHLAFTCRFSVRVAQPLSQHAPVEDASAREAQLPCFYVLSKHTPDGATGSEFCQFLAETTTLKCSTGKCYETWIRNKLYASFYHSLFFPLWTIQFLILPAPFPSLSPSISTVLSSHTSPIHLAQLSTPQNLFCLQQPGRTELYLQSIISHTTGSSVSMAEHQATNKMQAFVRNVRTSKRLHSHKQARPTQNSSRISMYL